jgi:hypothetical protein
MSADQRFRIRDIAASRNGKPVARRGRKATGLRFDEPAGLPKERGGPTVGVSMQLKDRGCSVGHRAVDACVVNTQGEALNTCIAGRRVRHAPGGYDARRGGTANELERILDDPANRPS